MMLPLLEVIQAAGGKAKPADVYDAVARRLNLSDEQRKATVVTGDGRETNAYERSLR